jgi:proteasome assembly chaperone (PAC2) family protein
MSNNIWVNHIRKPTLNEPIAIVGSPGLRSIGKLAIDYLVKKLQAKLIAELYSTHFPLIFHTKPSYASHPRFLGDAGVRVRENEIAFPRIQFHSSTFPDLLITDGYHANFNGQYEVAEKVLDFFEEYNVKKMIVLAGHGKTGNEICCAATNRTLIQEMKEEYGLEVEYQGSFYGFSGLVFGLAKLRRISSICLFVRTESNLGEAEYPDENAVSIIMKYLSRILNITL